MSILKRILSVAAIWGFWLLVLPYPFTTYITKCAANGTNCIFVDRHEWAWFGGYHIFIEHIFFFDSINNIYLGFTYPGVAGFMIVALLFAIISFTAAIGIKNAHKRRQEQL